MGGRIKRNAIRCSRRARLPFFSGGGKTPAAVCPAGAAGISPLTEEDLIGRGRHHVIHKRQIGNELDRFIKFRL